MYYICLNKNKGNMTIEKLNLISVPVEYQQEEGCVAFQMVKITYSFYGKEMTEMFDTKILATGEQLIISGNGFINDGTKIN